MALSLAKLWRFPILYPIASSSDFSVDEKKVLADQDIRYHVTAFRTYVSRWDLTSMSQLDVLVACSWLEPYGEYIMPRTDIKEADSPSSSRCL
jgi:hypothetical protein